MSASPSIIARQTRRLAALLLVLTTAAPLARAQGAGMEVYVGQYSPTQDLFQVTRAGEAGTFRLNSGSSKGGVVALDLNQRVGLRVSGGEVETALAFTPSGSGRAWETPAVLRHASVQGALGLTRGGRMAQPYVSLGISYAQRKGEAFEGQTRPTSYGMALGAGLRVRVSALAMSMGVEVLDYSATYDVVGRPPRDFIQRDVLLRLGGGVAVGR